MTVKYATCKSRTKGDPKNTQLVTFTFKVDPKSLVHTVCLEKNREFKRSKPIRALCLPPAPPQSFSFPVVNFNNNLRTAFAQNSLCQKITNTNCKLRKTLSYKKLLVKCWWIGHLGRRRRNMPDPIVRLEIDWEFYDLWDQRCHWTPIKVQCSSFKTPLVLSHELLRFIEYAFTHPVYTCIFRIGSTYMSMETNLRTSKAKRNLIDLFIRLYTLRVTVIVTFNAFYVNMIICLLLLEIKARFENIHRL